MVSHKFVLYIAGKKKRTIRNVSGDVTFCFTHKGERVAITIEKEKGLIKGMVKL